MSLQKQSPPLPSQAVSTRDLKHRVISCLNKLSDRDTLAVATTELESIARNLNVESFSLFLTCIFNTDSSEKSTVRRQCVRLLGLLSQSHGDALSPFLSKMLANIIRRLRDPDSAVRSACVDAVATMAARITRPPFSAFLKPLTDSIIHEQDFSLQIGAALCLASAIDASADPDPMQLQRILPRLMKLLKSENFKGKPALLSLIRCIVSAGGASNRGVMGNLIHCVLGFLSSEDWAARKVAAEVLERLAVVERDLASEYKPSCLASLESRRYDKVKAVRDAMSRTLEVWKDLPGDFEGVLPFSRSKQSGDNGSGDSSPPVSKHSQGAGFETPRPKKTVCSTRSPLSDNLLAAKKGSPLKTNNIKSNTSVFCKLDSKKPLDWKVEISVPDTPSVKMAREGDNKREETIILESADTESTKTRVDKKCVHLSKSCDEKIHKFGALRSGSRVVPFNESDNSGSTGEIKNGTGTFGISKDVEDLSVIRNQLLQIENQQSSLLDLLQRFIGSSQTGINSLETRVHGLEMALEEISYDLAVPNDRFLGTDSAEYTCCKLPGAEFLSPKFWRRTEGRCSTSRFSPSDSIQSTDSTYSLHHRNITSRRFQHRNGDGYVVNPLPNGHTRRNLEFLNSRANNVLPGGDSVQVCNNVGFHGFSPVSCRTPANPNGRSSALAGNGNY